MPGIGGTQSLTYRQPNSGCVGNGHSVLAGLQMRRRGRPRDVSLATVERGRVQCFGLDLSGFAGSEVKHQFKIFFSILIQDDHGNLSAGKLGSVSACVYARGLQLRSEVTLHERAPTQRTGKLQTVGNGLHHVIRAERGDRRIERVRMRRDLLRGCTLSL